MPRVLESQAGSSGSVWESIASVPVGTILPWSGGYFTSGSNTGFINVLGNDAIGLNSRLNIAGFYVCNGASLNLASSPIYNGAGRFLPNLTDSRFLMGSTGAGVSGGQNSITLLATNLPAFVVSTDFFPAVGSTVSVASSSHGHAVRGSTTANIGINSTYLRGDEEPGEAWNSDRYYRVNAGSGSDQWVQSTSLANNNITGSVITKGTTAGPGSTTSVATSSNIPSHTHTISTSSLNGGMNSTPLENRPIYLSVLYIQRVI